MSSFTPSDQELSSTFHHDGLIYLYICVWFGLVEWAAHCLCLINIERYSIFFFSPVLPKPEVMFGAPYHSTRAPLKHFFLTLLCLYSWPWPPLLEFLFHTGHDNSFHKHLFIHFHYLRTISILSLYMQTLRFCGLTRFFITTFFVRDLVARLLPLSLIYKSLFWSQSHQSETPVGPSPPFILEALDILFG